MNAELTLEQHNTRGALSSAMSAAAGVHSSGNISEKSSSLLNFL